MTDTKRLAKLMRHCCTAIDEITSEPLQDQQAQRRLLELQDELCLHWPWLGYSKLLALRHQLNDIQVS